MVYFLSFAFPFLFLAFLFSEPWSSELFFELGDGIVDRRNSNWKYRFYLPFEITETSSMVIDWRTSIVLLGAVINRFTLTFHFVAKARWTMPTTWKTLFGRSSRKVRRHLLIPKLNASFPGSKTCAASDNFVNTMFHSRFERDSSLRYNWEILKILVSSGLTGLLLAIGKNEPIHCGNEEELARTQSDGKGPQLLRGSSQCDLSGT